MKHERSPKSWIVTLTLPAALALTACQAPLDYGERVAPTADQLEAVSLISESAYLANSTVERRGTHRKILAMHGLLAELHTLAVLGDSPIEATSVVPVLHPLCVSGAASVGYRFDDCHVDESGRVFGEALLDGGTLDIDLDTNWAHDGEDFNGTQLHGNFERIDGRLHGTLEQQITVQLPGRGSFLGIDPGEGTGDVHTSTTWAVDYDEELGCIVDGWVEIEVEAWGERSGTRYLFDGCDEVRWVQNAAD